MLHEKINNQFPQYSDARLRRCLDTAVSFIYGTKKGGRTMNVGLHDNLHESK